MATVLMSREKVARVFRNITERAREAAEQGLTSERLGELLRELKVFLFVLACSINFLL